MAGNVVLERIAYGLYNMGLDIRRRATQNLALIRRSLDEHIRIVGPSRPATPTARPPRWPPTSTTSRQARGR